MSRPIPLALAIALAAGSAGAQSAVEDIAPGATPWQPWGGTWVRLEADGNLSCFSFNGKDCEWRNAVKHPAAHPKEQVRPLRNVPTGPEVKGEKVCLADMPPAGSFFDRAPIKGNSTQVLPTHELRDDIRVTGSPKFRPSTLLLQTQGTDQDELLIKDFILAVARRIPVEGSFTGERRPLPYTQGCDGF